MHFVTKISQAGDMSLSCRNNQIGSTHSINFLGLTLDTALSWTAHTGQLIPKFNLTCYVIGSLKSVMSTKELKVIYFAYIILLLHLELFSGGTHSIVIRSLYYKKE